MYWDDEHLNIEHYNRQQKHYYCGRELLKFPEEKAVIYQIFVIDYGECCFAKVYTDGEIEVIFKDRSDVPNKHRKGGQSSARFARMRDNAITCWFKDVNEKLKPLQGQFYVGISSVYYKRFFNTLSTYNQQKIKERKNCPYSDLTGIYQMVNLLEQERNQ